MNFIDNIYEKLVSTKGKLVFLILFILNIFSLATSYLFYNNYEADANNVSFAISFTNDLMQISLLLLTFYFAIRFSNKTEKSRSFSNPLILQKIYSENIDKALVYGNEKNKLTLSEVENHFNNKSELPEKFFSTKDRIVSCSVEVEIPKGLTIADIEFELMDEDYQIPWFIEESARKILLTKFIDSSNFCEDLMSEGRGSDYNGTTLAVKDYKISNKQLKFQFRKSFYFNYLVTNVSPEIEILGHKTIRHMIEPGPKLNNFFYSSAENHLGMSCLIVTKDNYIIIPKRSFKTSVFQGQLSPSVSGAANIATCMNKVGDINPYQWLLKEIEEELDEKLSVTMDEVKFIGFSRELRRLGKPELFFLINSKKTKKEVSEILNKRNPNTNNSIDYNENEKILYVPMDHFDKLYTENNTVPFKDEICGGKKSEYKVRLNIDTNVYEVSESLLVNLIYFKRYYRERQV